MYCKEAIGILHHHHRAAGLWLLTGKPIIDLYEVPSTLHRRSAKGLVKGLINTFERNSFCEEYSCSLLQMNMIFILQVNSQSTYITKTIYSPDYLPISLMQYSTTTIVIFPLSFCLMSTTSFLLPCQVPIAFIFYFFTCLLQQRLFILLVSLTAASTFMKYF